MKLNWLNRELFTSAHYFTLCTNKGMFKKALKHLNIPKKDRPDFLSNWHANATTHFLENREQKEVSAVVCLGDTTGRTVTEIYALLVHEAMHIWRETREAYGEHNPSAELEAYAIQRLSQSLMEEYERQVK